MALGVVVLAQAKVDEDGPHAAFHFGGEHYVLGLDVEVRQAVGVEIRHGIDNGHHYGEHISFGHAPAFDGIPQRGTLEVLHDIICSAVSLEHLVDLDDVGVAGAELLEAARLAEEIAQGVGDDLSGACGAGRGDAHGIGLALIVVGHEVLFEGHALGNCDVANLHLSYGEICNAEAAFAEDALYDVLPGAGDDGAGREGLYIAVCHGFLLFLAKVTNI